MSDVEDQTSAAGQPSVAKESEASEMPSLEALASGEAQGHGVSSDMNSRLRLWFWGTIALLAGATIGLMLLSYLRQPVINTPVETATEESELSPESLSNVLTEANAAALSSVVAEIPALLDRAYRPIYAAIPKYAEFHYSVWGSYVELGTSAMGDPTEKLEEILLSGMNERLGEVTSNLDAAFEQKFIEGLSVNLSEAGANSNSLGPLTDAVIEDARGQIGTSAVVFVGGAGAAKAFALAIGGKIGSKIAAKAAVKAGAKWGAATTGAISAGALCAWAGPGAGACAAVGGVAAWFATDAVVGKLDELISRDEFEADLRELIDEDKAARKAAITAALTRKAETLQLGLDVAVQDFTLRQLSGADAAEVCSLATVIADKYTEVRDNLWMRRPTHVAQFREFLSQHVGHLALKPLILEIDRSITDSASQMRIETVWIRGNVPSEFKGNGDVSARIALNGEEFDFDRSPATEEGGFQIRVDPNLWTADGRHLAVRLRLEQHRLLRNAIFAGEAEFDLLEAIPEGHGLLANVYQELPIEISDGEEGRADEAATPGGGGQIGLEMVLRGKAMPNLQLGPDCPA